MSAVLRAEIEQWAKDWSDENSFDPGMEGLGELHAILDQDAIRTATQTPTPPLVEVIAAALVGHWSFSTHTDTEPFVDRCDGCGEVVHTHGTQLKHALAAHQARAVLAAISEAGTVEWAVRQIHDHRNVWETNYASKADAEAAIQQEITPQIWEPAHRIAAGPWTAVEG